MEENKKYKKNHFIGIGIPLALPPDIPIGVAIGRIPIGLTLEIPIGLIMIFGYH